MIETINPLAMKLWWFVMLILLSVTDIKRRVLYIDDETREASVCSLIA